MVTISIDLIETDFEDVNAGGSLACEELVLALPVKESSSFANRDCFLPINIEEMNFQ